MILPSVLMLEPHNDDAALFAAFTCHRERPHIVTCLRSYVQERRKPQVTWSEREMESQAAAAVLRCTWEQWDTPDTWKLSNIEDELRDRLRAFSERWAFERVYAPAIEPGGHEHHSLVGAVAVEVFGPDRVWHYTTYRRGNGRTVGVHEITPSAYELQAKLRALACYWTQIREPSTRSWFMSPMREWLAHDAIVPAAAAGVAS